MKRVLIGIVAAGAILAWPRMVSAATCCGTACDTGKAACCDRCCEAAAEAVLLPATGHQHQSGVVRPIRQRMIANFLNPVRVGDRILMGKYVIEHDTERMARGLPCTHIYEFGKSVPVVGFHCVHLDRPYSDRGTVTLRRTSDRTSGMRELTEFQLQGEAAGHGVPAFR